MNFMTASSPNETFPASKPPNLLVAGHFVRTRRVGGAEQMLYNLLDGFSAWPVEVTLLCGDRTHLSAEFLQHSRFLRVEERGGTGTRFAAEQLACLSRDVTGQAMLFPNYYIPPVRPRRLGRVGVVIHDFQYRHYPAYFSRAKRLWLRMAQEMSIRLADRVIVISDFVRQDAVRWFGPKVADKVTVIPNAMSWRRFDNGLDGPRPMDRPYVLSVAAQYPHKNLETLIHAFAIVAKMNADIQLVLCGQSYNDLHGVAGKRAGAGALIQDLGLTDRVALTGFVDDTSLARWYQHAELFAFPSVFEGFGMPPVEALGFNLPTLITNATALPETTLGLAQHVSAPYDAAEWADKIVMILRQPASYRPGPGNVARLKDHYAPARVAGEYLKALSIND